MPVNFPHQGEIFPVEGIELGTAAVNIKGSESPAKRDDVAVISIQPGATTAALFTRSSFRAAPVILAENRLQTTAPRAVLVNSGNANAATGDQGLQDAEETCGRLATCLGVSASEVLPFSTGVIGERLPLEAMYKGIALAITDMSANNWLAAARAIMTTDTLPKCVSRKISIDGREVVLTGIAKGSGMIRPDMATMLAFIATDANIERPVLNEMLKHAAAASFNRITVDGDTSTNDSLVLIATGKVPTTFSSNPEEPGYKLFLAALIDLSTALSQMIIRDAEGATKFVSVTVTGGATSQECLQVAYAVAESPLVKTALFAGDPNWGRFCMAIGRAGLENLDTTGIDLYLDQVCVARGGLLSGTYREEDGASVMHKSEFGIRIELGRGTSAETIWTSDLTYEYVRINTEYRT